MATRFALMRAGPTYLGNHDNKWRRDRPESDPGRDLMERRVRRKSHARCGAGEKRESSTSAYLSLFILVPDTADSDADKLRELVWEVNRTHLEPQEILSDEVYRYDRKNGGITIA